jgi:hypothetical protein
MGSAAEFCVLFIMISFGVSIVMAASVNTTEVYANGKYEIVKCAHDGLS